MKHHDHTKRAFCVLLLFFILAHPASAISLPDLGKSHEVSAHLGGGLSTFSYKLSAGKAQVGFGGTFGLGYTYFFNGFLGINTGVDISLYNANAKVKRGGITTIIPKALEVEGDEGPIILDLQSTLSPYTERQRAYLLIIPVMLQFPPAEQWYAKFGVKVGFPISANYRISATTLTNEGYYEPGDNWYPWFSNDGLGEFSVNSSKATLKLTTAFMISLEGGMKFSLNKDFLLYAGIYFDYGLNDVGPGRTEYSAYDPTVNDLVPKSMLSSYLASEDGGKNQIFTERVVPLSVGLKVSLVMSGASGGSPASHFFRDQQLSRRAAPAPVKPRKNKAQPVKPPLERKVKEK